MFPQRFRRAVSFLEQLGYSVRWPESARAQIPPEKANARLRAQEINDCFADPSIRAILSTVGGSSTREILEHLDFDLILRNPKFLCGYSDFTAALSAIYTHTGMVVYHGPSLMPQFGHLGGPDPYTIASFVAALEQRRPLGAMVPSRESVVETESWANESGATRERGDSGEPTAIISGTGSGPLLVGNATTFLTLLRGPWAPPFCGSILGLEWSESKSLSECLADLERFRSEGVLAMLGGLLIGKFHPTTIAGLEKETIQSAIRRTLPIGLPTGLGFDFGHVDPVATIPWGFRATLKASDKSAQIVFGP